VTQTGLKTYRKPLGIGNRGTGMKCGFYFYSEEHMPIHVHVENADGRAKFSLEPTVELIKNEGMKPKDLKKAKSLCETFQEDFIEKWHEHMD
jgi:hypothetical protein